MFLLCVCELKKNIKVDMTRYGFCFRKEHVNTSLELVFSIKLKPSEQFYFIFYFLFLF